MSHQRVRCGLRSALIAVLMMTSISAMSTPLTRAAEGTDGLELASIAANVLELRSNGCGCGTNHYLMFPEGELVSLMISTLKRLSKQVKNMFNLGELTAPLQTVSATAGKRHHSFIKFTPAWVTRYAAHLFLKIHAIELFTLRTLQDQVAGGQGTPTFTNLLAV